MSSNLWFLRCRRKQVCNQLSHPYPLLRWSLEFVWDWEFGSEGLANSSWDHVIWSAQLCANFYRTPAGYTADRKTRRKRNMGCCVLLSVVSSLPPSPLPISPPHLAHNFTCLRLCLSGLEGQGRAPLTPLPLGQFWGCSGRSRERPLIRRSWVWKLILDSNGDYIRYFGSVIGHL